MAARRWTAEQRAKQSEKIQQWQPWNKATGPTLTSGKAAASRNAYKGGVRSLVRKTARLLREQGEFLNEISG